MPAIEFTLTEDQVRLLLRVIGAVRILEKDFTPEENEILRQLALVLDRLTKKEELSNERESSP